MHYPYQQSSHTPTTSINPSFVHTNASHYQQPQFQRQPSQQQSSPPPTQQGTLAPYVLHSPPAVSYPTQSAPSSVSTASFYAPPPPPQPSGPTPEQLKEKFLASLRPLLQPSSFTGAGAVNKLTGLIDDYGITKVDLSTRADILTKIRDNAGNHYFRAWAENELAMEITRLWLKESADPDSPYSATTMPLMHVSMLLIVTVPY